ncbi:MAG: AMP-binding protein, partial [Bacteroidota bacterium]
AKVTVGRLPVPGAVRWSRRSRFEPLPNVPVDPEKPALLTFTSGSTGRPKAAVRTHGFLAEQHRVLERHLALHPGEPALVTLPVFALAHLASGQPTIIADADLRRPGYIDPEPVFRQINRWKPTRVAASPAFFERLIEYAERTGTPLPVAGALHTGGAPVYPDVLDRLARAAPQATVEAVYGSTEAEPIAHVAHAEISEADRGAMQHGAGLLTGHPVEDIDVRILQAKPGEPLGHLTQEAFEERTQPAGEAGEIVVSGAHVLKHYWQGHGEAETKFDVGETRWHRTGDIGRLDGTGRLWLLGRATAVLHDEHGAVYPFAVEVAASALPGVQRTALAAVGSRRVLAVETQPGFDAKSVQEKLAWARLDEVRPVRQIPLDRRHNAKVDYPALKDVLET